MNIKIVASVPVSLVKQKTSMMLSVMLALALAFLLFGISYILFSDEAQEGPTKSIPNIEPLSDQIFWVILWIGMAALVAVFSVGVFLFVSRLRVKKQNLI